ncbi:MAG: AmmeMemoRadiSam system protein B [Anaerolineales bacterium]|nr:AmmeMemoRadiSam system protein B [Anaerolineales bacterium]
MKTISEQRPSPIAGTWYDGRPKHLAEQVDRFIDQASFSQLPGDVLAVIAPHAGHRFSGPVAGYAFAAVRGAKPDLVAVVSPMHQAFFDPFITSAHKAYQTPLGAIPIDEDSVDRVDEMLTEDLGIGLARVAEDPEHSLEIELPFLQRALASEFRLLPVMVRAQDERALRALGRALAQIMKDKKYLLVASTDLSHFYPQDQARAFDAEMLRQVEAFSPQGVLETERSGKGFACGHAALAAVLWAARELGGDTVKVLNYATSGDVTGDYASVVGYGAAVVLKTG